MKDILISSIGKFKEYEEVDYRLDDIQIKSKITIIPIIIKYKPSKILIIVLDSLIENFDVLDYDKSISNLKLYIKSFLVEEIKNKMDDREYVEKLNNIIEIIYYFLSRGIYHRMLYK